MNATILSNNEKHYPVLLKEILSIISPQNGGTFIDRTFGQGGYSQSILKFSKTNVIALDRDIDCKKVAENLEKICIETIENGYMTKDLALMVGPDQKWINTNQLFKIISKKLTKLKNT